jgi:hypothetical protein
MFLANCRAVLIAIIAYCAGRGFLTPADSTALTAVLIPIGALVGPWAWVIYANINSKLVPHDSVAISTDHVAGADIPKAGDTAVLTNGDNRVMAVKVVGAIMFVFLIFGALPSSAFAQTKPAGACSLQTFVGLFKPNISDPVNFLTALIGGLKNCGASDTSAALKDAEDDKDMEAVACLRPLNDIALAAQSDTGQGGVIYKAQKFRHARRAGIVTACTNYFVSTFGAIR